MKVAVVQMNSGLSKEKNLREAQHWLKEAVKKGARLVAFPEHFAFKTNEASLLQKAAETLSNSPTLRLFSELARKNQVWVLLGSLPLKKGNHKITNSSLLLSPQGKLKARYDKIHLFDAFGTYHESKGTVPGRSPTLQKTAQGPWGLSICYDLRFPELYRSYAHAKASLLFIPSAFTFKTGQAHWDVLTRARAIENQAYVLAPAQTGKHPDGTETYGHSRVIDPWGTVVAEKKSGTGLSIATLDFDDLNQIRHALPALNHPRLGLKVP